MGTAAWMHVVFTGLMMAQRAPWRAPGIWLTRLDECCFVLLATLYHFNASYYIQAVLTPPILREELAGSLIRNGISVAAWLCGFFLKMYLLFLIILTAAMMMIRINMTYNSIVHIDTWCIGNFISDGVFWMIDVNCCLMSLMLLSRTLSNFNSGNSMVGVVRFSIVVSKFGNLNDC